MSENYTCYEKIPEVARKFITEDFGYVKAQSDDPTDFKTSKKIVAGDDSEIVFLENCSVPAYRIDTVRNWDSFLPDNFCLFESTGNPMQDDYPEGMIIYKKDISPLIKEWEYWRNTGFQKDMPEPCVETKLHDYARQLSLQMSFNEKAVLTWEEGLQKASYVETIEMDIRNKHCVLYSADIDGMAWATHCPINEQPACWYFQDREFCMMDY